MYTNQNKDINHKFFMDLALRQASRNVGNTKDNPSVGCVITKNNNLISVGSTSFNGRPHAEVNAINFADVDLYNSTLYSTLEPCSHYGKSPPCTKLISKSKIKRVIYSVDDPDKRSHRKCLEYFNKRGILVKKGILSNKIKRFYTSYFKQKKNILPFITCKIAMSKDHYTINRNNKWITNSYSRARVHLLRARHDCILSSSSTVIKDNPSLDCRINGLEKFSPTRIILDNKLNIPINAKIFNCTSQNRTIIFFNKDNKKKINLLKRKGIKFYKTALDDKKDLDIIKVLIKIKELGFSKVFLECGATLTKSFIKDNLIDEFKLFVSNHVLKKNGRGSLKTTLSNFLSKKKKIIEKVNLNSDKFFTYIIK